jgi:CubicO group peptidase (beta-lactamase class C family)
MRDDKTPGLAIGIVKDGRLVYARGFGVMKLGEAEQPVTPETIFHMASVTKPFVGTAVMQLVEQGRVDLDSPVTKYLPYFELKDDRFASITVRHLLTHTSGMPDVDDYRWDKPEYDAGSLERHVRSLRDKPLLWAPGTKFAYSNLGYEVLGDLVAKASGKSFEDFVEANILAPLNMTSSTLLVTKADPARIAPGYTTDEHGQATPVAHYPYNRCHTPSSNLHSNVADMAKWVAANLNRGELNGGRILKSSTFDEVWSQSKLFRVGISWFFDDRDGQQVVWHDGDDTGFQTLVKLLPARGIGVIVMANSDEASVMEIGDKAFRSALGKK